MHKSILTVLVLSLVVTISCNLSPEAARDRYMERGNKSFAQGNYSDASLNFRRAIQKDPRYGQGHYKYALSELKLGQVVPAYRALQQAAQLMPENEEVVVKLADLSLSLYQMDPGRPAAMRDRVARLAESLLARNPNSFDGARLQGHLAMAAGKAPEAVRTFEIANRVRPMQPEIVLGLSQALFMTGGAGEAEKLARELIVKEKGYAPIYDVLYVHYVNSRRLDDAEKLRQEQVANNPKQAPAILQLARHFLAARKLPEMRAALQRLLDSPTEFPQARLQVGDFYLSAGNAQEAMRLYEEGAKTDPGRKNQYQKRIAETWIAQGNRAEALKVLDAVVGADAKDHEAGALRAGLLLASGKAEDVTRAVSELKALVDKNPDRVIYRFNLGRAYLANRDVDSARAQFQEAVKRQPAYFEPRFALGELSLRSRQYKDALRYADDILALNASDPRAQLLRVAARMGLGNLPEARVELERLMKQYPGYPDALLQMGLLNIAEKKYKDAEAIFRKLYQPGQRDLRPLEGLVAMYASQNDFSKAEGLLQQELARTPDSPSLRRALADTASRAQNYDLAIEQFRPLLARDAGNPFLHTGIGELYFAKGDLPNALSSFQQATALAPKDKRASLWCAHTLYQMGRTEEAKAAYRKTLEIDPEAPQALNNLAYILTESRENLDEAMKMIQRALKKAPQDPNFLDTMGLIYVQKGSHDVAIQIYQNLTQKYATNPTFRYHYALALFNKGDKSKAKQELENALSSRPNQRDAEKIRALLAQIG